MGGKISLDFRGFIAINIKVCDEIKKLQNELKKTGADLKLVETENMHLTLKFLGKTKTSLATDIKQIITESVENIKPFNIKLKGMGVFPNEKYIKIIWVGIEDDDKTVEIAKKIDEQFSKIGFKKEKRSFSPHLTIARVKSAKNKEKIIEMINKYKSHDFVEIKIDYIELKKSKLTPEGPIYTTMEKICF